MFCLGRVFCNFCECYIGTLLSLPAESPELLHDLGKPPHFALCPDCFGSAFETPEPLPCPGQRQLGTS